MIPDLKALQDAFRHVVGAFVQAWRGKTPDQATLGAFMAEADRAYFIWQSAEAGYLGVEDSYTAPGSDDVHTGHVQADRAPAMFVSLRPDLAGVPRLHLVRRGARWAEDPAVGAIVGGEIVL